ncbi:MAG: PIN domain-containing protein [Gemmatales bacterium]
MIPVFDTNILIDYLNQNEQAKEELRRNPLARISVITWVEVMVGAKNSAEESHLEEFLKRFTVIDFDAKIATTTVLLRTAYRLRFQDAAIWATAKAYNALLITRDVKGFSALEPDIRVPYVI